MEKLYGTVEEVYIPKKKDIDIMLSNRIGFIIKVNDKLYKLETDQNDDNAQIMKNDKVVIIKQVISGEYFIDIEKLNGDVDE